MESVPACPLLLLLLTFRTSRVPFPAFWLSLSTVAAAAAACAAPSRPDDHATDRNCHFTSQQTRRTDVSLHSQNLIHSFHSSSSRRRAKPQKSPFTPFHRILAHFLETKGDDSQRGLEVGGETTGGEGANSESKEEEEERGESLRGLSSELENTCGKGERER